MPALGRSSSGHRLPVGAGARPARPRAILPRRRRKRGSGGIRSTSHPAGAARTRRRGNRTGRRQRRPRRARGRETGPRPRQQVQTGGPRARRRFRRARLAPNARARASTRPAPRAKSAKESTDPEARTGPVPAPSARSVTPVPGPRPTPRRRADPYRLPLPFGRSGRGPISTRWTPDGRCRPSPPACGDFGRPVGVRPARLEQDVGFDEDQPAMRSRRTISGISSTWISARSTVAIAGATPPAFGDAIFSATTAGSETRQVDVAAMTTAAGRHPEPPAISSGSRRVDRERRRGVATGPRQGRDQETGAFAMAATARLLREWAAILDYPGGRNGPGDHRSRAQPGRARQESTSLGRSRQRAPVDGGSRAGAPTPATRGGGNGPPKAK